MSDQAWGILGTLRRPSLIFEPTTSVQTQQLALQPVAFEQSSVRRINPKIIVFFAVNMAVGSVINQLIPGRRAGASLFEALCVALGLAIFNGATLHLICKALRGRGDVVDTLSSYMQVTSTVFLVSSAVGFVWSTVLRLPRIAEFFALQRPAFRGFELEPITVFFTCQLVLQAVYLSIGMVLLHKLSTPRTVVALTLAILVYSGIGLVISIAIYLSVGVMGHMGA